MKPWMWTRQKWDCPKRSLVECYPEKWWLFPQRGLEKLVHHLSLLFLVFLHFCLSFPWSFSDFFSFLACLCVAPFLFQISAFLFVLLFSFPSMSNSLWTYLTLHVPFTTYPILSLSSAPPPPYPSSLLLDLRMSNVWDSGAIAAVLSHWGLPPPGSE